MVFTQQEFHPAVQKIQISKVAHLSELCPYIVLMFWFCKARKFKKKKKERDLV